MTFKTGFLAAILVVAAGCSRDSQRTNSAANTPPAVAETNSASQSISEARCARETRCDNVGGDKKYSTLEDCIVRVRTDWQDDLNARECPSGVNQHQLNECLSEIRNEECGNPLDSLERIAACTSGQICEG
jgi:hypothetical protein